MSTVRSGSLYEDVREHVADSLNSAASRLTSQSVTDNYIRAKVDCGEWTVVSDNQRTAEYGGVQQLVRSFLRSMVPDEPEVDDEQIAIDLPEHELLQNRYSVKGEGADEYYVRREELTEEEMRQIVGRFRNLAVRYERHAKALEAAWYRAHESQ